MISINEYIKQTIMFTNSLVIKSLGSAISINKMLVTGTGIWIPSITNDKKTWRYFMNIAGQKHSTNNDVKIFVSELGRTESLTKELLEEYPITKKELLSNGNMYDTLMSDYPMDRLYIHGCMYPVDIQTAIDAPDGTILAYNPNYVEEQEYSLIREIEQFTKAFFQRWYIKEFILIEELYMATVLANLYTALPNKIINIRLSKVLTPEVHSFHMEHFFRSNLDIWDEVQVLTPASRMWLYKNLRYLKNNIGKNVVLNTVIEKILNANSIGIGSYVIRSKDVEPNLVDKTQPITSIDKNTPVYTKNDGILSGTKLNAYYEADDDKTIDTESVITLEMKMVKNDKGLVDQPVREDWITTNSIKKITSSVKDRQDTKIIEFSTSKIFKMYGSDLYKIIFDHWVYFIQNDTIGYYTEYIDPNNNKIYALSPRSALLVMIKYLLIVTKNPNLKLTSLNYNYILNPDKNVLSLALAKMHDDGYTKRIIEMVYDLYPNASRHINAREDTCAYIQSVVEFYTACWFADANSASVPASASIKHILQLVTVFGSYQLTDKVGGKTVDELLAEEGIYVEITDEYDVTAAIEELFDAACMIKVDAYNDLDDNTDAYVSLVNKLTSYTVQPVNASGDERKIFVFYNNTDIYRTQNGIIQPEDGILVPYDTTHIPIKSYGNSFEDEMYSNFVDTSMPEITIGEWPISGYMFNINDTFKQIGFDPWLFIEVHDYPFVDVADLEFKDEFFKAATGLINPLQPTHVPIVGGHNTMEDVPTENWAGTGIESTDGRSELWEANTVAGYAFVMDSDNVTSDHVLNIEITDF